MPASIMISMERRAAPPRHRPVQFFQHSWLGAFVDFAAPPDHRFVGVLTDRKAEAGGKLDGTEHPNWIFLEPNVRVADGGDDPCLQVGDAADVVDDLLGFDVVEQAVDRKVPALRIFGVGTENVVAPNQELAALVALARIGAKRRGFDDLATEEDMSQAKASADDPAVAEQLLDFFRGCAGGDVEVFWRPA